MMAERITELLMDEEKSAEDGRGWISETCGEVYDPNASTKDAGLVL